MTNKIKYSSELMTNYVQSTVVSPLNNFIALHTVQGNSLLFAVGTNNAFNVITEESGATKTGWQNTDLSTSVISNDFKGHDNLVCKTFEAAQSVPDGSIGMGMAVCDNPFVNDTLYLCLNNSNSNLDWLKNPQWTAFPYDNTNTAIAFKGVLSIQKIFFTESSNGIQYIVVDVLRDSTSPVKDIKRYTIDPTKSNGTAWLEYDLSIDIEAENYTSCIGHISTNAPIDGLYTLGKAGTCNQIEFRPVINYWGSGPINPTLLYLPDNLLGDSMTSARDADNNTDLFVTSNNGLYYFSAYAQAGITPTTPCYGELLLTDPLLHNTKNLFASTSNGFVYLWGINSSDQVFYTKCSVGNQADSNAWSTLVPVVSQVDLLSPYINIVNGGNTIFCTRCRWVL